MKTLIDLNLFMFLTWGGIMYFVLRYRVHVHIEIQKPMSLSKPRRSGRGTQSKASDVQPIRTPAGMKHASEIAAALQSQGLKAKQAKAVAAKVCSCEESDFDVLLRRAIQEAA